MARRRVHRDVGGHPTTGSRRSIRSRAGDLLALDAAPPAVNLPPCAPCGCGRGPGRSGPRCPPIRPRRRARRPGPRPRPPAGAARAAGPTPTRRRRRPPFAARNAVLARLLGDPTEEARLLWLRRLDEWARTEGVPGPPADRVVDRFARLDRASVAVLGDPGAGRGDPARPSRRSCWPPRATPTSRSRAATSVRPRAGCGPTRSGCSRPTPTIPPRSTASPAPTTGTTASPAS